MLTGLQKYSGSRVRQRGSSPKLLALDTGLISAMSTETPIGARSNPGSWGRLVESAIGAHLFNTAGRDVQVTWWRERGREVDFVLSSPDSVLAIEVASGRAKPSLRGLAAFSRLVPSARTLLVGGQGLSIEETLSRPASWLLDQTAQLPTPSLVEAGQGRAAIASALAAEPMPLPSDPVELRRELDTAHDGIG